MSIEKRLDEYLSQFNDDDQERILRYALDHIVPRMKYRTAIQQAEAQQPATGEPVAWNSIQIASWIGSQLMHEPSLFERATVCKFVRSLGRHPTLLKHSPKIHPAPSVPDGYVLVPIEPTQAMMNVQTWDFSSFYSPARNLGRHARRRPRRPPGLVMNVSSRFHIERYPLKGKNAQFSLRVVVKDNRRRSPHLNDIINLRRESGTWRIFLHGRSDGHFFVQHQGTLKSAIATYVMLHS